MSPTSMRLRRQSVKVSFAGAQAIEEGLPSLSEISATEHSAWAATRFTSRLFHITRDLQVRHFDFQDEGWAVNLVPFRDGSVWFRQALVEGGSSDQIRNVLRFSPAGAMLGKLRSPDRVRINWIERLGTDMLIASAEGHEGLFYANGDTFTNSDKARPKANSSVDNAVRGMRRANDGAVWYLRGFPPNIIGRLDPDRTAIESTIRQGPRSYLIAGFTPIGDSGMLLFLGNPAGHILNEFCVVKNDRRGKLTFSFSSYAGSTICAGHADPRGRLWFIAANTDSLNVVNLFSMRLIASAQLGATSLAGCDPSLFAPFNQGMLIPGLSSVDFYSVE